MRSALLNLSLQDTPIPNPLFPGDHPDPSIIRVGQHYWACTTSSEWSPQFPLFHSADLRRWEPAGHIFTVQPRWAEGSFWAPELVHDRGRFLVYYVAKARGGPLSIAAATATSPQGPWTDRGPMLAEPLGSIDPAFTRDEHGKPYLVWKTDGNSQHQPTPIWAQPLSSDLLHLTGSPTQLITNDQPWEDGVVEGAYIQRHAGHFYMFYAGNTCCGRDCHYAEGVARAERLLGPWEKSLDNPLINDNDKWRCPGHGTAVRGLATRGKPAEDYLLYHAYPTEGTIYVGREAVLDRIDWGADGWPRINAGQGPHSSSPAPETPAGGFRDEFLRAQLGPSWQWPVNTRPLARTGLNRKAQGELVLRIPNGRQAAMIAVPIAAVPRHMATVLLGAATSRLEEGVPNPEPDPEQPETPVYNPEPRTLWAGLSIVGDPFNTVGLGVREGVLELWIRRGAGQHVSWREPLRRDAAQSPIWLRVQYLENACLQFWFKQEGYDWMQAGEAVDGSPLPQWDRGLRIGLMLEGPSRSEARFQHFAMQAEQNAAS